MTYLLLPVDECAPPSQIATFLPDNFDRLSNPALIVFLHGFWERGYEPGLPLKNSASVFEQLQLPAAIVFPQCDDEHRAFYGRMETRVNATIEKAIGEFRIDRKKIYLVGFSMGGSSSLWLTAKHPDKFAGMACIAPGITWMGEERAPSLPESDEALFHAMFVAGDRSRTIASKISRTPVWFLQGTEDVPCPIDETRSLVYEVSNMTSQFKYTEYSGVDHDCLVTALYQEGLFDWLFSFSSSESETSA